MEELLELIFLVGAIVGLGLIGHLLIEIAYLLTKDR